MKNNIKQRTNFFLYLFFAAFYFWLAAQIPYTHDDWDWGLDIGIQQLITANLNSRYAGNFFEVVMTRSMLLKTILLGSGYFLVPLLVSTIVSRTGYSRCANHKTLYYIICNVLILLMSRKVWQQTYGWVAGFANFVISVLFLLLIMKEGLCVFDEIDKTSNHFSMRCIALLVVGIISQLFLENVAIFLMLFSLTINWIYFKRTSEISKEYLFLTLGTIIGLTILFSSSIYQQLWHTGNAVGGYRHMNFSANSSIGDFIYSTVFQIGYLLHAMINNNTLAYGCILLLLNAIILLKNHRTKWLTTCFCINSCFLTYFFLYYFFGFISNPLFLAIVNIAYVLIVTGELILLFKDIKLFMAKLLLIWLSVFAVIAPLIVTSESGARLYFTTHTLIVLLAVMLFSSIIDMIPHKIYQCSILSCMSIAIILMGFFGNVYFEIGACMRQRNAIIAQSVEVGATEITLPNFPHTDYLWAPNPTKDSRLQYFKEFYGIPQDVIVHFE